MYGEAEVRDALSRGEAITWDTCHKIYIAMDNRQVGLFQHYGYDPIIPIEDVDNAFQTLCDWYEESCGLRFISAVETVIGGDPNSEFTSLVPQFAGEDESESEDEESYA